MVHPTFQSYMEAVVIPQVRRSGISVNAAGRFWHRGRLWRVQERTSFKPLLKAYEQVTKGREDPFIEEMTETGGTCLVLRRDLWPGPKYLYIYPD
jgi:hypothetical protein